MNCCWQRQSWWELLDYFYCKQKEWNVNPYGDEHIGDIMR